MITYNQTFTPANNGTQSCNGGPSTRSVLFVNDSDYYALVRLGGNDYPATRGAASLVISPHEQICTACPFGNVGIRWTTNPTDTSTNSDSAALSPLSPDLNAGAFSVVMYAESQPPYRAALPNAPTKLVATTAGQSLPWGLLGTSGVGDATLPAINITGWGALRLYLRNGETGIPHYQNGPIRFQVALSISDGTGTIGITEQAIVGPDDAYMCQFPVPFVNTGNNANAVVRAIVTVYATPNPASGNWCVLPMLVQSQERVAPKQSAYYHGEFAQGGNFAFGAGARYDLLSTLSPYPVYVMGISREAYSTGAALGAAWVTVYDTGIPVEIRDVQEWGWTTNAGNGTLIRPQWGPVTFENAIYVEATQALSMYNAAAWIGNVFVDYVR